MFLDAATLQDLEIVPTPLRRGPTLWALLDRTKTRIGRETLRQKLLAPPHSADDILALQRAHRRIATDAASCRALLDAANLDGVEEYLDLNWQLPQDMGSLAWRQKWHSQYMQDVASGQLRIRALVTAADQLRRKLSSADAAVLKDVADQIASILGKAELRELVPATIRGSSSAKRDFDQLARDRAKPALRALITCLGNVEAMWSLAAATLEHGWSYPRPAARLAVVGLVHPFLGQGSISNDFDLERRVRVCFITGPNMAGKSTFMKAVAIAVFLAHLGCGVPAASMDFPTVGAIFSSVQIVDNLGAGESFYLAEVRRMRMLAVTLLEHRSVLAVVDEPFRGTNVHDAAEATLATIARLAAHPAALVLVASHVGEVVPSILDDPRIRLFQFSADMSADEPHFDYTLRAGVSVQRLGMTLLRREGVLEILERSAAESPQCTEPVPPVDGSSSI